MKIIIKNGNIIDPINKRKGQYDILIEDGKIVKVEKEIKETAGKIIEAQGKIVCPGFIDLHVHLREPGMEDKETIKTGTKAAIKGGFTTVACMPNTTPSCDNESIVSFIKDKARKSGYAKVLPIGSLTKAREGKDLSEMAELKRSGCLALSDDGDSIEDNYMMRQACDYAKTFDLPVFVHCEDHQLGANGVMNEGHISTKLGLAGIPNKAESIIIQRDIDIAELTEVKMHICHLSTKEGVEMIKNAKKKGLKISAEVTPHHLALTDEACLGYDTNTKMNPPLRTKEDVKALKKGLKEGVIDVIATDHAPHLESEKDVEFDKAPFGIIGLETAFSICKKELVDAEVLPMEELIEKLTVNPAKIIGIEPPSFTEGAQADITIIDPEQVWVYEKKEIVSKSTNSPFIGHQFKGKVKTVLVNGKIVMEEGAIA